MKTSLFVTWLVRFFSSSVGTFLLIPVLAGTLSAQAILDSDNDRYPDIFEIAANKPTTDGTVTPLSAWMAGTSDTLPANVILVSTKNATASTYMPSVHAL